MLCLSIGIIIIIVSSIIISPRGPQGNVLMTLTEGGMQHLLAGALFIRITISLTITTNNNDNDDNTNTTTITSSSSSSSSIECMYRYTYMYR